MKVDETGEVFTEKLKAFTLELPDYKDKSPEYPKLPIEYWLYNLVNMETMTTSLPFQSQQPIFGKVGGISELVHMSEEERVRYNVSLDTYRTNLSVMKNERKEGAMDKALETARKMILDKMPVELIEKYTGLSKEIIKAL